MTTSEPAREPFRPFNDLPITAPNSRSPSVSILVIVVAATHPWTAKSASDYMPTSIYSGDPGSLTGKSQ
jgi:hypothetical protein